MLNNLRHKFDPLFEKIGVGFASLGFGPNFWTWVGFLLSIISAIMFSLHSPAIGVHWYTATLLGGIFLIIAGFFDAVDGAVARATKKTSALGAFLDSVIDKVSEIIIFIGILIGNFTNPILVLITLSLSLLVSYTRARAESIGVDLKGKGIAERAERILIISILAFIPFQDNISIALWIISVLAVITVLERLKVVSAIFGVPLFSIQACRDIFRRDNVSDSTYSNSNISNSTKFDNEQASSSKVSTNIKEFLNKPDNNKNPKPPETRSNEMKKASFIDKTDPNEMGRNAAQIISEQENEDNKIMSTTGSSIKKDNNENTTSTTGSSIKKDNNENTEESQSQNTKQDN